MKTVNKPSDNLGGIARVWCIPPAMVTDIRPVDLTGESILEVYSLGTTYSLYCIPESLEYTETEKQADAGSYFEAELTGRMAKDSPELWLSLRDLRGKPWVVVYQDQNSQYKVIGSPREPLWFTTELKTGAQFAALNHVRFAFTGALTLPGRFLQELPQGM